MIDTAVSFGLKKNDVTSTVDQFLLQFNDFFVFFSFDFLLFFIDGDRN